MWNVLLIIVEGIIITGGVFRDVNFEVSHVLILGGIFIIVSPDGTGKLL